MASASRAVATASSWAVLSARSSRASFNSAPWRNTATSRVWSVVCDVSMCTRGSGVEAGSTKERGTPSGDCSGGSGSQPGPPPSICLPHWVCRPFDLDDHYIRTVLFHIKTSSFLDTLRYPLYTHRTHRRLCGEARIRFSTASHCRQPSGTPHAWDGRGVGATVWIGAAGLSPTNAQPAAAYRCNCMTQYQPLAMACAKSPKPSARLLERDCPRAPSWRQTRNRYRQFIARCLLSVCTASCPQDGRAWSRDERCRPTHCRRGP